jgi:hypothetical protein
VAIKTPGSVKKVIRRPILPGVIFSSSIKVGNTGVMLDTPNTAINVTPNII